MAIGAYDDEEAAARAYDLAALKYWGPGTLINFPVRYCMMWLYLSFKRFACKWKSKENKECQIHGLLCPSEIF